MSQSESDEPGDDAQKSHRRILAEEIEEGLEEIDRPSSGLALSALSAGLDIGFGPLLMVVVVSNAGGGESALVRELLIASAYAVGFLFVVLGRSALFTEHTVLATLPVLNQQASVRDLGRVWGVIYVGNLAGCAIFVALTAVLAPGLEGVEPAAFADVARVFLAYPWWMTLLGGVLAGWLMGLLSWLVVAARDTTGTIVVVWLVAGAIGFAHLPHSIAGTIEVLFGLIGGLRIGVLDYLSFLTWSTIGNVVGGVVFVSIVKYSHGTRTGDEPEYARRAE